VKFLIMAKDYFTKRIEVEPLAKMTTTDAMTFFEYPIQVWGPTRSDY